MKNLLKFTFVLFLSITFFACSEDNEVEEVDLVDNSSNINELINSFDVVLKTSIQNPSLSNETIGGLFIDESRNRGLKIVEINTNSFAKTNKETSTKETSTEETSTFSSEYLVFSSQIENANSFLTKEDYKTSLVQLNSDVLNLTISNEEKQILVDNIGFMIAFVDWMSTLVETQTTNKSFFFSTSSSCSGWWSCWGKCVAGTIGSALTTGLEGCGIGAAVGGAASGIASLGLAAPAGIVGGCVVGGVIGAIGGGLSGAAESC